MSEWIDLKWCLTCWRLMPKYWHEHVPPLMGRKH